MKSPEVWLPNFTSGLFHQEPKKLHKRRRSLFLFLSFSLMNNGPVFKLYRLDASAFRGKERKRRGEKQLIKGRLGGRGWSVSQKIKTVIQ